MTGAPTWSDLVRSPYPNPGDWNRELIVNKRDVYRFARLWLTEGIPFAFRDCPFAFEKGRDELGKTLDEDPKSFGLQGSAKLGYSLASTKFGRGFDAKKSDLDLFAVSERLFDLLSVDAELFSSRVKAGQATAGTSAIQTFWNQNASDVIPRQLSRGFLDVDFVPPFERYKTCYKVSAAIQRFQRTLVRSNVSEPYARKSSLRVFRSWEAAVRQIGGTLVHNLEMVGFRIS